MLWWVVDESTIHPLYSSPNPFPSLLFHETDFLNHYFDSLRYLSDRKARSQAFNENMAERNLLPSQQPSSDSSSSSSEPDASTSTYNKELKSYLGRERALLRKRRTKLRLSQFHIITQVGQGGYGEVFLARKKETGQVCALKKLRKRVLVKMDEVSFLLEGEVVEKGDEKECSDVRHLLKENNIKKMFNLDSNQEGSFGWREDDPMLVIDLSPSQTSTKQHPHLLTLLFSSLLFHLEFFYHAFYHPIQVRHVLTERDILTATRTPWLVRLLYAFQDQDHVFLAMVGFQSLSFLCFCFLQLSHLNLGRLTHSLFPSLLPSLSLTRNTSQEEISVLYSTTPESYVKNMLVSTWQKCLFLSMNFIN